MGGSRTLQERHLRLDVTTPAGTLQAAPQSTAWDVGWVVVDAIHIRIPPGHCGLTGIAVLYGGVPVLPSEQPGVFWVGDDEAWELPLGWEVSGPFALLTYNADIYPHTHYLHAHIRDIAVVQAGPVAAGGTIVTSVPMTPTPTPAEVAQVVAPPPAEGPSAEGPPAEGPPAEGPPAEGPGPGRPVYTAPRTLQRGRSL